MIDIKKFAASIESQRAAIIAKLKRLKKDDPMMSTDRSLIVEPGTDAGVLFGHEQVVVLEQRLKRDLAEIESALKKVKKGTYGKCEKCGKLIDPKRLEVKPSAIYCLADEQKIESKKR